MVRPGLQHKEVKCYFIIWERKILRQIFGYVKYGNIWRIRTNVEIEHFYNEKDKCAESKKNAMTRPLNWKD